MFPRITYLWGTQLSSLGKTLVAYPVICGILHMYEFCML